MFCAAQSSAFFGVEKGRVPVRTAVCVLQGIAAEGQHAGDGNAGNAANDQDGHERAAGVGTEGKRV